MPIAMHYYELLANAKEMSNIAKPWKRSVSE